jgi:hypothetical protein
MYLSTSVIPSAGDIHARCHGAAGNRTRVIDMGGVTLHVEGSAVLFALRAALREIEADMDAAADECFVCHRRPAEMNVDHGSRIVGICDTCWQRGEDTRRDWSPGELAEAFGR